MSPQRVRLRDHFGVPEFLRDWGLPARSALRSRWTEVDGLRLHSRSASRDEAAPPFVLIHGLIISSLYFIPLAEALARRAPVHALDLPGYGRSEKPAHPLGTPALADFVARWIETMGFSRCHIVGNSFGSQVAAELAVRHANLVETVTLIGPTVDPRAPTLFRQALRLLRDMPREPARLWLNHLVDDCRAGPRFAIALMRAMIENHIETNLPRITAPTLVMRGECDPIAPERWAREAVRLLLHGSLNTIPRGSHCVHYAAPDSTAAAIFAFLDHLASAAHGQLCK
jgi:pimeloyl-ACP methyl ester carboxylesterase